MSTGATDSRYLRNLGMPVYGISGLFSHVGNNGVHGQNEQVAYRRSTTARNSSTPGQGAVVRRRLSLELLRECRRLDPIPYVPHWHSGGRKAIVAPMQRTVLIVDDDSTSAACWRRWWAAWVTVPYRRRAAPRRWRC